MVQEKKGMVLKALIIFGLLLLIGWLIFKQLDQPRFSSDAKVKHVVVISIDALRAEDFDYFKTLPNFRAMLENGSMIKEVKSIYPSLTYPAHTTIITGVYPGKHGITANNPNQPGVNDPDWYWYYRDIKSPTLFDYARKSNMKVGTLFWPVTAGADLNYNLPEIWPNKPGQSQVGLVLKNGTPLFAMDVNVRFGKMLDGKKEPNLDNFTAASAAYMIKSRKPNLTFIHLTDLDHFQHVDGVDSKESQAALKRQDERLGEIVKAVKESGLYDETAFVVLGDHGAIDTQYNININTAFVKAGLITLNKKGEVTSWKVNANSCDGSTQIYLHDPNDRTTRMKVESILSALKDEPSSGIEAVFNRNQIKDMELGNNIDFILEGKPDYYFTNNYEGELVTSITPEQAEKEERYQAVHGYLPDKHGNKTFFAACGPGIKQGKVITSGDVVDIGPTIGAMLGIHMKNIDGRVIKEIFSNN
jgi:predicted AlkP superfamily pyrophosphatase or phosphodiesterase